MLYFVHLSIKKAFLGYVWFKMHFFLEKSNNSKRTLISDLCCPEIVFAFKIYDLLLYWKSLYGKFPKPT